MVRMGRKNYEAKDTKYYWPPSQAGCWTLLMRILDLHNATYSCNKYRTRFRNSDNFLWDDRQRRIVDFVGPPDRMGLDTDSSFYGCFYFRTGFRSRPTLT